MKKTAVKNKAIIYQTKSGAIELRGDMQKETLWATQAQIVELFSVHQSVVSRHINNIFKDGEVDQKSNMLNKSTHFCTPLVIIHDNTPNGSVRQMESVCS